MNSLRTFFQYKNFSGCKQAMASLRMFTEIISVNSRDQK